MNSDNKRIVKNTIYLYIRMLITICVSLYTSRVILDVLGLSDYGLYNLIGGTLILFSFINSAMEGCTQRYLNIAIGKRVLQNTQKVFSIALTIHLILSILFFVIMLIVGLYLVEYILVIPPFRIGAARLVLMITLLSACFSFIFIPFNSAIIAHEKMNFYAFMSIFDVTIKLLIVFALMLFKDSDKLILYAILNLATCLFVSFIYYVYCTKHFPETGFQLKVDLTLMKEMFSFTGWNLLGNLTYVLSTQGVNVMLNFFYGTLINAAWGVATQVNGVLGKFSSSFQIASSPQIMKYYAAGDNEKMFSLTKNSSKYAAFLVALIGLPLFIEIDFVLSKWLVDVPEYSSFFVRMMIIMTFISASSFPVSRAIVATGRIKESCIFSLVVRVAALIGSFVALYSTGNMKIAIYIQLLPPILGYIYMLYLLRKFISVPVSAYLPEVFLKIAVILLIASIIPILLYFKMEQSWTRCILVTVVSIITIGTSVYFLGLDAALRRSINNRVLIYLKINKNEKT